MRSSTIYIKWIKYITRQRFKWIWSLRSIKLCLLVDLIELDAKNCLEILLLHGIRLFKHPSIERVCVMLYFHYLILGISLCVDFWVENLQKIRRRETARASIIVPVNSDVAFIFRIIESSLYPVLHKMRVWVSKLPNVLQKLNVLEEHQVLPFLILAKVLQLGSC